MRYPHSQRGTCLGLWSLAWTCGALITSSTFFIFTGCADHLPGALTSPGLLTRFARSKFNLNYHTILTPLRSKWLWTSPGVMITCLDLRCAITCLGLLARFASSLRPLRGLQTTLYVMNPRAPWPCTNRARVCASYRTFSWIFINFTKNVLRSALYVVNPRACKPCTRIYYV